MANSSQAKKILLNADISLDGIIQLLSSQSLNKCFARPYDANLIKSAVYAAQMGIQEPLRSAFTQENAQPSVLIVDDEVYATKYLKKNLQLLGAPFEILCAANAQAALDLLEQHKASVAVIVSDHKMPGMKGNQLLNKIRNIQPNIVRILTSAYGEIDVALDAINEGSIFQYIKKPWDAEQVLGCINQALDRHRVLQQQSQQSQLAVEKQQQQILDARIKALNTALESKVDGIAGPGALGRFIGCIEEVELASSYSPVHRENSQAIESQLLKALCDSMQPKLDEIARLLALQGNTQQDFIRYWSSPDSDTGNNLASCLAQELERSFAVLMAASAMPATALKVEAAPDTIRIALPKPLKIYSHLLGPVKKISERFIQQQTALLMLFVIAGVVQGELSLEGSKQSLGLSFTCALAGES